MFLRLATPGIYTPNGAPEVVMNNGGERVVECYYFNRVLIYLRGRDFKGSNHDFGSLRMAREMGTDIIRLRWYENTKRSSCDKGDVYYNLPRLAS